MESDAAIVQTAGSGVLGHAVEGLWMRRLLRRAAAVGAKGEIPVAAVVLDGSGRAVGYILARAYPFPRWTAPPSARLQSKPHEHRSIP